MCVYKYRLISWLGSINTIYFIYLLLYILFININCLRWGLRYPLMIWGYLPFMISTNQIEQCILNYLNQIWKDFFTYNLLFASLPYIQLMCFYFSNQKIWWDILFSHFNCLDKFCSSPFFNVFCFKILFFYNFFAPYLVFLSLDPKK